VGAWIETSTVWRSAGLATASRPAWARGLKRPAGPKGTVGTCRAPRGRVD